MLTQRCGLVGERAYTRTRWAAASSSHPLRQPGAEHLVDEGGGLLGVGLAADVLLHLGHAPGLFHGPVDILAQGALLLAGGQIVHGLDDLFRGVLEAVEGSQQVLPVEGLDPTAQDEGAVGGVVSRTKLGV